MPRIMGSNSGLAFGDFSLGAGFSTQVGHVSYFDDVDMVGTVLTRNSNNERYCIFVKNTSGVAITPGMALNWVAGFWGSQVQACPPGSEIRCYAPSYVRGSTVTTIPNNAYFWAIKEGFTSPLSDGTSLSVDDGLVAGAVAGQVRTDFGLGGGEIYSQTVASTVLTNSTVATKYDKNYTFPANSLNVGDTIRVRGSISVPSGNSTNTLATDLMLGTQVISTLAAFDPTDAGGDIIDVSAEIEIRTIGASGTMVAIGTFIKSVNGSPTVVPFQLQSTVIDTTATQQLALRGTWSVASAANQSRQDILNVSRLSATNSARRGGTCTVASVGTGTAAQFRAAARCQW